MQRIAYRFFCAHPASPPCGCPVARRSPKLERVDDSSASTQGGRWVAKMESRMKNIMRAFWKDESGQDMAEYALLLSLIALAIIGAVIAFRGAIIGRFQAATTQLGST